MQNVRLVTTQSFNEGSLGVFRIWKPLIGEKLVAKQEFDNSLNKYAMKVVRGIETVGHLPCEFSRIAWYFLARSGEISVEVIGRRRRCKQLCGRIEIPCHAS